jgi:hypothetical protein
MLVILWLVYCSHLAHWRATLISSRCHLPECFNFFNINKMVLFGLNNFDYRRPYHLKLLWNVARNDSRFSLEPLKSGLSILSSVQCHISDLCISFCEQHRSAVSVLPKWNVVTSSEISVFSQTYLSFFIIIISLFTISNKMFDISYLFYGWFYRCISSGIYRPEPFFVGWVRHRLSSYDAWNHFKVCFGLRSQLGAWLNVFIINVLFRVKII